MNSKTLTTDFTADQLANHIVEILQESMDRCVNKMRFHLEEINSGNCNQYHIDMLDLYKRDRIKWIEVIRAAKDRDDKAEKELDALFN